MNSPALRRLSARVAGIVLLGAATATAAPLVDASLRNGDYGGGTAVPTFDPNHGGSPDALGIVDSPLGVTYTSTESDGRSNALINFQLSLGDQEPFRTAGTVSFCLRADRALHVTGYVLSDNFGYDGWMHGQSSFSAWVPRVDKGTPDDKSDDQFTLNWKSWHDNVWYYRPASTPLEYDRWYRVGVAWGGSVHAFETWADGTLVAQQDLAAGQAFPWGQYLSATNMGLGDNHQRGYQGYGTAAGVSLADVRMWRSYVAQGDTQAGCAVCGDGAVEPGEDCDDGNTQDGDCCSSTCHFENRGSTCTDDGVACTTDRCDGAGTCAHTPDDAACDDGNVCTDDHCDAVAGCGHATNTATCDDGDTCTTADQCEAKVCTGRLVTVPDIQCRLEEIPAACPGAMPKKLGKVLHAKAAKSGHMLDKATAAAGKGNQKKAERLRGKVAAMLGTIPKATTAAAATPNVKRHISAECKAAIDGMASEASGAVAGLAF